MSVARSVASSVSSGIARSQSTGAFTPTQIFAASETGFLLDFSNAGSLYQNSGGTGSVVADSPVGRCDDLSGNGNASVQTTADRRPVWRSGGVLEFDGDNDRHIIPDSAALSFGDGSSDSPFTIAVCGDVVTGNGAFVTKYQTSNREYTFGFIGTSLYTFLYDQSETASIGRSGPGVVTGSRKLYTMTYSGSGARSGIRIYVNDAQVDTTNEGSGSYTAMEDLAADVGVAQADNAFGVNSDVSMAGALLVSRVLSTGEISQLASYWGAV